MKYIGETFLGSKTTMCNDHITIIEFDCLY